MGGSIPTSATTTPLTVKHAPKNTTSLYYAQYLRRLISCPLTGKHAYGGFLYNALLFPVASPVQLMNDRSTTRESLSGSFHLSFCTDLPLPAAYILFIYLQGDHCFLQVYRSVGMCVCVCEKDRERHSTCDRCSGLFWWCTYKCVKYDRTFTQSLSAKQRCYFG